ncbi:diacylglycerol/lipid kinase family protein [Pseudoroseicyclus aestuarii]|uniref:Diacylglycerol kinase family enzyme n=1 Tax=Pseudoroseicyclus aestuarii TaxID=1795041 RepID=A0A318SVQ2_9RHOB|nr:diacylglycerol kinase family protein [Pseudoroseicyclus aestuarii]PYE84449.1 diacylglycerol kinase family enzyme [Pseudoroseicyclus aestuarii]
MKDMTQAHAAPARADEICVICNEGSGRNSRGDGAVDQAMTILGDRAVLRRVKKGASIPSAARQAVRDGFGTVVAAGGDGTIMAVSEALVNSGRTMGVLPLGTFNFFARGYGIPEDPQEAARLIAEGAARPIDLGAVEGRPFLNNASLGVYPAILKERESVYKRWGRRRIAAHWSVLRTFWRYKRPLQLTLRANGEVRQLRTPLVFVARSAYQLEHFGLDGAACIREGKFAVFVAPDEGRLGLLRDALRLAIHKMDLSRGFELICTDSLEIETRHRRCLVACDGEKFPMKSPLSFEMMQGALLLIHPEGGPQE